MFDFKITGEVSGIASSKEGDKVYLRIKSEKGFAFQRAGEQPYPLQVTAPTRLAAGLSLGTRVDVTGTGAVGSHAWTKKEFGVEKTKDIQNYYFVADKIVPVKAQ